MILVAAPREVVAPAGRRIGVRYSVVGAVAVTLDWRDPLRPSEVLPPEGLIEFFVDFDLQIVRLLAIEPTGARASHTITVVGWCDDDVIVDGWPIADADRVPLPPGRWMHIAGAAPLFIAEAAGQAKPPPMQMIARRKAEAIHKGDR